MKSKHVTLPSGMTKFETVVLEFAKVLVSLDANEPNKKAIVLATKFFKEIEEIEQQRY
jgi:hypothetical protein